MKKERNKKGNNLKKDENEFIKLQLLEITQMFPKEIGYIIKLVNKFVEPKYIKDLLEWIKCFDNDKDRFYFVNYMMLIAKPKHFPKNNLYLWSRVYIIIYNILLKTKNIIPCDYYMDYLLEHADINIFKMEKN